MAQQTKADRQAAGQKAAATRQQNEAQSSASEAKKAAGEAVEALAWGHRLRGRSPGDQQLRAFAEAWLGEGAPKPCS